MARSIISIVSAALLAWEFYGATLPRLDFFELDASLPYPVYATPSGIPGYIGRNPAEILSISTPRPAAPNPETEPGMYNDTERPDTQKEDEPVEVTLMPGSGDSFLKAEGVVIHNETKINIDMDKVMARKLTLELPPAKSPQILIIHTHRHESYYGGGNIVEIGEKLAEFLIGEGFNVIHDRTEYDKPNFSAAYSSALKGVTKILKDNPGIQVVLDIHRDAITGTDGTVKKPVAVIDGEKTAQLMFVVGTNNSGLPHNDWPHNLAFAVAMQKLLVSETPELMRPINLRRERFNQHTTRGSLILEVGAHGNSFEEAERAIKLFAGAAAEVLK